MGAAAAVVKAQPAPQPDFIFILADDMGWGDLSCYGNPRSIRDDDWKLLMSPDASRVELYSIPADPGEMDNLAKTMPEITKKMTLAALAWQKTPPVGPVEPSVGRNDRKWPT